MVLNGILYALTTGCRYGFLDLVAVDSATVEARKGGLVGYDGYRPRKALKIHVAVSRETLPLSIAVWPGINRRSDTSERWWSA